MNIVLYSKVKINKNEKLQSFLYLVFRMRWTEYAALVWEVISGNFN